MNAPAFWRAARTSIGLSVLFIVVYSTTNYLASQRAGVPSFYFEWERHIPFVPLFIIPYMSIDLFFVAAPFLCRTDGERRTLARRITAAILVAGLFFLLMPLRFAFERPHADGWLGVIFDAFREMDAPFNEFPSLHIALATLLAPLYSRRFGPYWGLLFMLWFSLIRLSALFTYQHHVVDIVGGFALAAVCIHLFGDRPLRVPVLPNRRVAGYYFIGAMAVAACSLLWRPWSLLLLWPAFSLLLVAAAYTHLGPGIYRKTSGRLSLTTHLVLWPVLLGQRISLWHYSRQCAPWNALSDHVWIGRRLSAREARQAADAGVRAVLDLTGEFDEAHALSADPANIAYLQLPILDLTAPTPETIAAAIAFLREHTPRGIVYIHCKIGYSRTAAIAGAWLLETGAASSPDNAIAILRAARPGIVIRPEIHRSLHEAHARALKRSENSLRTSGAATPSTTAPEPSAHRSPSGTA